MSGGGGSREVNPPATRLARVGFIAKLEAFVEGRMDLTRPVPWQNQSPFSSYRRPLENSKLCREGPSKRVGGFEDRIMKYEYAILYFQGGFLIPLRVSVAKRSSLSQSVCDFRNSSCELNKSRLRGRPNSSANVVVTSVNANRSGQWRKTAAGNGIIRPSRLR